MAVIFVDILGTQFMDEFEQKHFIHRLFHEEVELAKERQKTLSHVVYDRKLYSFSDCAYFFYFYKDGIEEKRKNDDNLCFIAAFNASLTILKLMKHGFLVRGGIAFGDTYLDDLGFFGPAVERAHKIESKEAIYPRIMFDSEIGKSVYNWERSQEKEPIMVELMKHIPSLVENDDDTYCLNSFYQLELSPSFDMQGIPVHLQDVVDALENKIKVDRDKFSDNECIMKKLDWMENKLLSKKETFDLAKQNAMFSFMPS
jgi:hypothetical protein